ncbi:hypothetical protein ACFFSY_17580 [Paenibacillus aurantiacus]|uniref:Uncharacterized protein n=1 Tax=Paenibacillus aurantiacus TaxID=1936118 RepID=A0ABV5KUH7_9BACL
MEIKSEKGEVLAILHINSNQELNAIDSLIRELRPGMGKGIYIADEQKISQQTNYEAIPWQEGIDALKAKVALWEPVFPVHADVLDIQVYYGFDNLTQEEINEMAVESEKTGGNVVRDLKPNDTLVGMSLRCRQDEHTFELRIFGTTKSRIHVPELQQGMIENLMIRANEAVYVGNTDKQQLIWAEVGPSRGKALQYELIAEQNNRDWLIALAGSLA